MVPVVSGDEVASKWLSGHAKDRAGPAGAGASGPHPGPTLVLSACPQGREVAERASGRPPVERSHGTARAAGRRVVHQILVAGPL